MRPAPVLTDPVETGGFHAETLAETRAEALAETVADALGRLTDPRGEIYDPVTGDPTPVDHYAHTFTALALHCRGGEATAEWRRVLEHWVGRPPECHGHAPFNRLALQLLADRLHPGDHAGNALVRRGLARCVPARRYASNNWAFLAQTLRLGEAAASSRRQRQEMRRLLALADRWTTAAGGFRDFPNRPWPRWATTPTAYHFKYLLCLWLAWCQTPQTALERHLRRALDWTGLVMDTRNGYSGGLGRSAHALFGDAALLVVLRGLAQGESVTRATTWATTLERRLVRQQRNDGLLWLNPSRLSGHAGGWDRYMVLTVYNAWAAGLLLAQRHGAPRLRSAISCHAIAPRHGFSPGREEGLQHDPDGGVARARIGRWDVMLSTHGQPAQGFGGGEADFRHGVSLPFHALLDGRPVVPPPARVPVADLRATPALAGWSPLVECDGMLYGAVRTDGCRLERKNGAIIITTQGIPTALFRTPEGDVLHRLRDAVDWRLLDGRLGRRAALRPRPLPGHRWSMRLTMDGVRLTWRIEFHGRPGSPARILNLFACPLLVSDPPAADRDRLRWRTVTGAEPTPDTPHEVSGPLGPYQVTPHAPLNWPDHNTVYEYVCNG